MRWQARIDDTTNQGVTVERRRDGERIRAMPLHPKRQRFDATQDEKAVEGACDPADRILQKPQALRQLVIVSDDSDAANHVGVAVEVLCGQVFQKDDTDVTAI